MTFRSEVSCIQIMAPFLWYLYCEPSQLQEYAKLRLALLKVLLQPRVLCDKEQPSILEQQILQLCCNMVPCLQVRPFLHLHLFLCINRTYVTWKTGSRNTCRVLEMKETNLDFTLIYTKLTTFIEIEINIVHFKISRNENFKNDFLGIILN